MIELRMSCELANWLGAITPSSLDDHRRFRARGDCIMVRDSRTMRAMFWAIIPASEPPA